MYENGVMEGYIPEEGIRSALKHGTLAIGQTGWQRHLNCLLEKTTVIQEEWNWQKRLSNFLIPGVKNLSNSICLISEFIILPQKIFVSQL